MYQVKKICADVIQAILISGREKDDSLSRRQDRQHERRTFQSSDKGGIGGDEEVLCKLTTSLAHESDQGQSDFRADHKRISPASSHSVMTTGLPSLFCLFDKSFLFVFYL